MPNWISCGASATRRSKPAAKLATSSPGRPAIRSTCRCASSARAASEVVAGRRRSSAGARCGPARPGRRSGCRSRTAACRPGNFAIAVLQLLRQMVGNQFEMHEQRIVRRRSISSRKKSRIASEVSTFRLKVRSTNLNWRAPRRYRISSSARNGSQRERPGGLVQRRQAELALERTAARGLDVQVPLAHVLVGVIRVGQGQRRRAAPGRRRSLCPRVARRAAVAGPALAKLMSPQPVIT